MSYPYRFFIAKGESLQKIRTFLAEQGMAENAAETYRHDIGAAEISTAGDPSARFPHGAPAGWKLEFMHDSTYVPDLETPEGREADERLRALNLMRYPRIRFAKWLGMDMVDTNPDAAEDYKHRKLAASFEQVGDDFIIHVPVITRAGFDPQLGTSDKEYDSWVTPPDAIAIKVSDYFNRLERAGKLSNTPDRPFEAPQKKQSRPGPKPA